jgi:mannose-6-phosphate isomerase-like protein (cupin superfamily)
MAAVDHPIPDDLVATMKERVEYVDSVGGIYFRALLLPDKGDLVPQHAHDYDHVTLVCAGAVRMWVNGVWVEDIPAFRAVLVKAGAEHVFQALHPMTRLACVHNLAGKPYPLES